MNTGSTHTRWNPHPETLKAEAVYLARIGFGGGRKVAKTLGRRHGLDLAEGTVQDWIRGVKRDLDPLAGFSS